MIDLSSIPTGPGVYLHKDKKGVVIYVGKAKSLRKRVSSYTKPQEHPRLRLLCKNIVHTDYILTRNEIEALILENKLIKKHQPKYNVLLKDGKSYAYIHVTEERIPQIRAVRRRQKTGQHFGPFPSSVYKTVQLARNLFALRTCKHLPDRVCLNYHIGLCSGPCESKVSQENYRKQVDDALDFLQGNTQKYEEEFESRMMAASGKQEFELAKRYRDKLFAIRKLHQEQEVDAGIHRHQDVIGLAHAGDKTAIALLQIRKGVIVKKRDFLFDYDDDVLEQFVKLYYSDNDVPHEIICPPLSDETIPSYLAQLRGGKVQVTTSPRTGKKALQEIATKNAFAAIDEENPVLMELQQELNLNTVPHTIECFDISNISSAIKVGVCVSFKDGKPYKSGYRKYTVKTVEGQDDFRSMHECVKRRYAKMEVPDLIVIDGGEIQLRYALQALRELGKRVPIVGLAKREETIVFPGGYEKVLNRRKQSSKLLISVRDETHRFAISFYRQKHRKTMSSSELDKIEGIGPATKFKLLRWFGSVENIKKASLSELRSCAGKKGDKVHDYFR